MIYSTEISEEDYRELANQRARNIRDYLVLTGGISVERVFLKESADQTVLRQGSKVLFSLR